MSSQQPSKEPTPADRDNIVASSHEAEVVPSPVQNDDQLVPDDKGDDGFESEEEWEDTVPVRLEHRGKGDRPTVGVKENSTDGGGKKTTKRSEDS